MFLGTILEGRLVMMDIKVKMPEKIKETIKKYGDYVDLFEHGTEKEIKLVNNYMGYAIHEMQECRKCD